LERYGPLHQRNFEELVENSLDVEIGGITTRNFLKNPRIKCEDAYTEKHAREKAEKLYKSKLKKFLDLVINKFEKNNNLANEIEVQRNEKFKE